MIGYVMLGTNNLKSATNFFDNVLEPLGLKKVEVGDTYVGYAQKNNLKEIEFYVTEPFDGEKATVGNGCMVSFYVASPSLVDDFHKISLQNGATNEGDPGPRPSDGNIYYGYIRDLDGNKICAYSNL